MLARETFPLDDVEVIVFVPNGFPSGARKKFVFTAMRIDGEWQRSSGGVFADSDGYFGDGEFEPTHWMPLPAPPVDAP